MGNHLRFRFGGGLRTSSKRCVAAIAMVLFGGLSACFLLPSTSHSFRITLDAEVDGQPKRASSVYRITVTKFPSPSGWQLDFRTEGDAVYLDLGEGRHLLLLIGISQDGWAGRFARQARDLFLPKPYRDTLDEFREVSNLKARKELTSQTMPILARLRDVNNPRSLQILDPARVPDIYGPGVRVVSVILEMTRDPVTRGIEKTFPWITGMKQEEEKPGAIIRGGPGITISSRLFTRS